MRSPAASTAVSPSSAWGKLGARELNYVSDVDLIYVVKAADADTSQQQLYRIGTKMGTMLQRVCSR